MQRSRFPSSPLKVPHCLGPSRAEPFSTISVHSPHFLAKLLLVLLHTHLALSSFRALVQIPLASTWSPEVQHTAQNQLKFYSFSQRNLSMSLVRNNLSSCLYFSHRIWIILASTTDKGLAYFRISNVCVCDILRLWLAGSHLWHSFFLIPTVLAADLTETTQVWSILQYVIPKYVWYEFC